VYIIIVAAIAVGCAWILVYCCMKCGCWRAIEGCLYSCVKKRQASREAKAKKKAEVEAKKKAELEAKKIDQDQLDFFNVDDKREEPLLDQEEKNEQTNAVVVKEKKLIGDEKKRPFNKGGFTIEPIGDGFQNQEDVYYQPPGEVQKNIPSQGYVVPENHYQVPINYVQCEPVEKNGPYPYEGIGNSNIDANKQTKTPPNFKDIDFPNFEYPNK